MTTPVHRLAFRALRPVLGLLAIALAVPATAIAASKEVPEAVPSEQANEAITRATARMDKSDWPGAIAELDGAIRKAKPGSYDICICSLLVAQCHLQTNNYAAAVPPLERALDSGYLDSQDSKYALLLSQLYFQTEQYARAESRLKELLIRQSKPDADMLLLYATTLYQENKFPEALVQAKRSMRARLEVTDAQLQLVIACCQQAGNYEEAIGFLETLVRRHPDQVANWNQLAATYASANNTLGALLAIERAREHGFMTRPADNLVRVQLLYNLDQFDKAADLLDRGLSTGSIEDTQGNWELLAHCYKQRYEPAKVREVLERASAATQWGALDLQLAEINWVARRFNDTVANVRNAMRKGSLEKPGDVNLLLASAYFELGEFTKAREALQVAAAYPELKSKVDSLRRAIDDSEARRRIGKAEKPGQPPPSS